MVCYKHLNDLCSLAKIVDIIDANFKDHKDNHNSQVNHKTQYLYVGNMDEICFSFAKLYIPVNINSTMLLV